MTRDIGFLIFPDFQLLDAAGPIAAFEIAGRFVPGAYRLRVLACEPGPAGSWTRPRAVQVSPGRQAAADRHGAAAILPTPAGLSG